MSFDLHALLDSLPIMGYGMAGIFMCIVVIMLVYLCPRKGLSREKGQRKIKARAGQ